MKSNLEPIRNWFGYTRRERRSSVILITVIIVILILRIVVPEKNIVVEDLTASILDTDRPSVIKVDSTQSEVQLFSFDPNKSSYDTLIKLGFSEKEARTLISFRNKGGKFRRPSDIKKVYGIEGVKAEKLIPFVKVNADTNRPGVVAGKPQKPLIDLNSCDSSTLVTLPGIGPVLSVRIIKYRKLLGGYASVDQLKEVYGLPPETFEIIKGRVYADSLVLLKIKINAAGYKELSRLPYFEKYEVNAILKYRELKGRLENINDLVGNKLITQDKAGKVRPYLNFE
jgi:competence protein ComEA